MWKCHTLKTLQPPPRSPSDRQTTHTPPTPLRQTDNSYKSYGVWIGGQGESRWGQGGVWEGQGVPGGDQRIWEGSGFRRGLRLLKGLDSGVWKG